MVEIIQNVSNWLPQVDGNELPICENVGNSPRPTPIFEFV
jgi:hypothetical protein